MDATVRFAGTGDIETLVRARFDYFAATNYDISDTLHEELERSLASYYAEHLGRDFLAALVELEGELVSCAFITLNELPASLYFPTGKTGKVLNVLTYPQHRRRGFASQAMNLLIEEGRRRRLSFIELSATADGRTLYEELGFKENRRPVTDMRLYLDDTPKQALENEPAASPELELLTDRLILRTVTQSDISEVARTWDPDGGFITHEQAQNVIENIRGNMTLNKPDRIFHLCLAVFEPDSDQIIGWCGLDGTGDDGKLWIFFSIDAGFRGLGYATECAKRLVKYAFEETEIQVIDGGCERANIPSYKVMEHAGFELTGFLDNGDPVLKLERSHS